MAGSLLTALLSMISVTSHPEAQRIIAHLIKRIKHESVHLDKAALLRCSFSGSEKGRWAQIVPFVCVGGSFFPKIGVSSRCKRMCPADPNAPENNNDDKKLWLDYLGKLQDRADRANQITGVTNWVLLALMGTILYKGLGLLSAMLSDKSFRYNTEILTILCLNLLIFSQAVLSDLLPTIEPDDSDIRAVPARLQLFLSGYVIFLPLFAWPLAAIESWMCYQSPGLPRIVRISLVLFAIFHFSLALAITAYLRVRTKIESLGKGILPQFRGPIRASRAIDLMMLLGAGAALASIAFYVRAIIHSSTSWLLSMQLTFGMIVFLCTSYTVFVLRPARRQVVGTIAELERQALLENLSAWQIKERFERLTLGTRLHEWLRATEDSISRTYTEISNVLETAAADAIRLCSTPASPEKLQNLEELKGKLHAYRTDFAKPFAVTSVQIGADVVINWSFGKMSAKETIDSFMKRKKAAEELDTRLNSLFKQLETELRYTAKHISQEEEAGPIL